MSGQQIPVPLDGNRDLGPAVNAIDAILYSCSTIIVILRLITRIRITHNLGFDDILIALAQVRHLSPYYSMDKHE